MACVCEWLVSLMCVLVVVCFSVKPHRCVWCVGVCGCVVEWLVSVCVCVGSRECVGGDCGVCVCV